MNPTAELQRILILLGGEKIEAEPEMPDLNELVAMLLAENDELRREPK